MKRSLLTILLFLCCWLPFTALAQGENNVWAFADSVGINFNTTPPSYFKTNMSVVEGSAAVSDASGSLLFYTSGYDTWDKNGNLMPNGHGLLGNGPILSTGNFGSAMTGVAVVKSPSNDHQYYLIVTDAAEDQSYNAHYSLIDMTLNGGLGDVVSTQKDILLISGISEGVVTTRAVNCAGYWAVLHSRLGKEYYAFKIDAGGMSTVPVVSNGIVGVNGYDNYGMMRFNHAGNTLVRGFGEFELGHFDPATGSLSSFVSIQSTTWNAAFAFSPDDSKLYLGGNNPGIVQMDMTLMPNVAAMQAAQYLVSGTPCNSLRTAPNGKIYIGTANSMLREIQNPNAAGAACGYSNGSAIVTPLFDYIYEMGNPVVVNPPVDTVMPATHYDTVCFAESVTLNGVAGAVSYMWDNGAVTASQIVSQDGVYWVRSNKNCVLTIDTFHITLVNFVVNLGNDTNICKGMPVVLNAYVPDASYRWQDGSMDAALMAPSKGTYRVSVTKDGCVATDSVKIAVLEPYLTLEEQDTLICNNRPFELHAEAFPESTYTWNNGATGATVSAGDAGLYVVAAHNVCGTFTDSVRITTMTCLCDAFVPNAFTPNGDGANDVFNARLACPGITDFVMRIYNRYGQRLFDSNDIDRGWDGTQNGTPVDVGSYFYYVQYKTAEGEMIKKKGDVIVIR